MWASPELAGARGRAPRPRAVPQLGAAVGPRAADLRARGVSDAGPIGRAIAALRAGRPVRIDGAQPIAVLAVETATPDCSSCSIPSGKAPLLLSGERAAALVARQSARSRRPGPPVLIERRRGSTPETALALADPGRDLDRGPIGPLQPVPVRLRGSGHGRADAGAPGRPVAGRVAGRAGRGCRDRLDHPPRPATGRPSAPG